MRLVLLMAVVLASPVAAAQSRTLPSGPAAPIQPTAAAPQTKTASKESVLRALKGEAAITPAGVASWGKDADLVLIDLVRDTKLEGAVRARAVDALGASGSPVARDQLVRVATVSAEEAELPLLRRALLALGWVADGRAPATIAPWLSHESSAVRVDAATALALTKTAEARDLLQRRLRDEKDAPTRARIERLVRELERTLPPPPRRRAPPPRVAPPPPMEGRDATRF